jgi:transcriptional regulator with XRE-family HTH domain
MSRGPYLAHGHLRAHGLAGALRLARIAAGLTQAELAELAQLSRTTTANIENGWRGRYRARRNQDQLAATWSRLRAALPALPEFQQAKYFHPEIKP